MPKVYVRDCGLLLALLNIPDVAFVLAPVAEGWPTKLPAAHTTDVISPAQLARALGR